MNTKRKTLKMPVRYLMNLVLVGLLFVGLSYVTGNMLSTYQNKVLLTVGINIILAVSLNVATGYLGQLPLGHAGFMAVGAYACALFTKSSGLPKGVAFAIGLVLAWVIAGLFGVLIGIPALRLTGDYLAILTLGFGEIIRITLNNIDDVLGFKLFYGSKGLKNIPKYSNFTNVFLCVVITCFLIHAMMKSRHGRAVLAIRDNEIAAESCGIQTTYYKVMAFAFSAAFAGLAGGLYACYIGVLNPSTFGFMKSIEILVIVVLGGLVLRERVQKKALFCAVLCSLGILLLIDPSGAVDPLGVALALTSGVTYAVYILLLAHFRHREVMGFRMTFYMALISAVCMFFPCLFSHQLCLPQTLAGWLAALAFSLMICIGAVMLFQKGTFLIGAQRAAILSTFEPITSIFVGILFLNETLTPRILLGSAIILVAGVFITLGGKKDEDKEEAAKD